MTGDKPAKPSLVRSKRGESLGWQDSLRRRWQNFIKVLGRHKATPWVWSILVAVTLSLLTVTEASRQPQWAYCLGLSLIMVMLLVGMLKLDFLALGRASGHTYVGDISLLGIIICVTALLAKGYHIFASAFHPEWLNIHPAALALGAPLATGALLASLFLGQRAGVMVAIVNCLSATLLWPSQSFSLSLFHFIISLHAVYLVHGSESRMRLIRAGLWCSVSAAILIVGWLVMSQEALSLNMLAYVVAIITGPLSGVLAAGLVPVIEALGHPTEDRIRAMASLDHPAMRDLMLHAPGTYHHCLVVSSLVEAAAREIGADHLLARTAALYHDLGKIKNPVYFVENIGGMANRHDKLAPSMSALILISHVKDGVDLARKYRLSASIQDIISQHHGNRVISYFYSKACESARQAGQPEPSPDHYRYPGPKPQTREAGLVMLADVVEAASRALTNPTAARLQTLVKQQINAAFTEGQMDECELTLKDLHNIARIFNTILSGIYHHRIEYPEDKKNADNNQQPAKKLVSVSANTAQALAHDADQLKGTQ